MSPEPDDAEEGQQRTLVENQLEITVKLLRQGGLLHEDQPAQMVWVWRNHRGEAEVFARAAWLPAEMSVVVWLIDGAPHGLARPLATTSTPPNGACKVKVQRRASGKAGGEPWSLICPIEQTCCRSLFWVDGRLASRQALGLEYWRESALSRRMRIYTGQERTRMGKLEATILSLQASKPSAKRPFASSNAFATAAGLSSIVLDEDRFKTLHKLFLEAHPADLKRALETPLAKPPDGIQTDLWDLTPRLEIATLAEKGHVRKGEFNLALLSWLGRTPIETAICIDLRKSNAPLMLVKSRADGLEHRQVVTLVRPEGSGGRWRMLCPVTGLETKVLAFRYGRWASMKAQRLVYKSQRSARFVKHSAAGYREMPGLGPRSEE